MRISRIYLLGQSIYLLTVNFATGGVEHTLVTGFSASVETDDRESGTCYAIRLARGRIRRCRR